MFDKMTGLIRSFVFAVAFACAAQSGAAAQPFFDNDGPVLIWVTIKAYSDEGPWQACRRVYQRDVFQVAAGPGNKVRCRIDHSRIYRPGEVRQNFNRN
jgi:hypothetical protein